ncbi:hypothetical protein [Lactococcus sp. UBA7065]|nr:hypothetical protein [Lactococcus sp. UBA7065]
MTSFLNQILLFLLTAVLDTSVFFAVITAEEALLPEVLTTLFVLSSLKSTQHEHGLNHQQLLP